MHKLANLQIIFEAEVVEIYSLFFKNAELAIVDYAWHVINLKS